MDKLCCICFTQRRKLLSIYTTLLKLEMKMAASSIFHCSKTEMTRLHWITLWISKRMRRKEMLHLQSLIWLRNKHLSFRVQVGIKEEQSTGSQLSWSWRILHCIHSDYSKWSSKIWSLPWLNSSWLNSRSSLITVLRHPHSWRELIEQRYHMRTHAGHTCSSQTKYGQTTLLNSKPNSKTQRVKTR